jgi:L-ascorbate metabolism protein UlaG (beta-lactamase superfamily)
MRDFTSLNPTPGSIAITWLGQAGYLFTTSKTRLLLDAYVSPLAARAYDGPAPAAAFSFVDVVACTHEHLDHLDPDLWATLGTDPAATHLRFVAPRAIAAKVRALGIADARVSWATPGTAITLPGVTLHAIEAVHGVSMTDAYTSGKDANGDPRFLGYVLDFDGLRVYHAGDTLIYPGLLDAVKAYAPHVVLLPINGRDAYREARGVVGNMSFREAARFAADLAPKLAIPFHYDLFSGNTEQPGRFVDELYAFAPGVSCMILGRFATITVCP